MMTFRQKAKYGLAAVSMAIASTAATAAVDVSATITELGDVKTAVLAIGIAVLAIAIGIKLYKWVKAAL
jgi:Inovirus Coat protein B